MTTGSHSITLADLAEGGLNAPVRKVDRLDDFSPATTMGASRYSHSLGRDCTLDALLVNNASDILVVSFHGALDRRRFTLPRFERLNSLKDQEVSSLYFADPALHLDPTLELAWFTGWHSVDLTPILAQWVLTAARAVDASRIILTGSSGGGFAALQVSSLIPHSLAIPFNPQTAISAYFANGFMRGPQRKYVTVVMPELAPDGFDRLEPNLDWASPLGERLSAVQRYARKQMNYVLYATNPNDFHHRDHFLPLAEAAARGRNVQNLRVHEYDGPAGHTPPTPEVFTSVLGNGIEWVRGIGDVGAS
ncbi:hypothetical protein [Georgenia muralis]|uniref:Esterase n=1 Tax=Georgenia muralis TaxID=154117 RepID=A0A3N4Z191_9MICO|nr:hypothetical protein [Georgenia muralis]RPF26357.1 hypothetical protein EDD32_0796 [Georgenia muralis]